MLLNCGVGEDSWESLGLQGNPTSLSWGKSILNICWKDWCWSWNSNTLATLCEELTLFKRPWCWERLKEGREGDDRGWGGWMASLTRWTFVWVSSGSWWWTGNPGVLQSLGSKELDATEQLNWTDCPAIVHTQGNFLAKKKKQTVYYIWSNIKSPCKAGLIYLFLISSYSHFSHCINSVWVLSHFSCVQVLSNSLGPYGL